MKRVILFVLLVAVAQTAIAQKKNKTVSKPAPAPQTKAVSDPLQQMLSEREREIFAEINLARTNPAQYLSYLQAFKKNYHGKEIRFADGSVLVTNEGVSALDEAIDFVKSQSPKSPLQLRKGMILAAKDHANYLAKTEQTGHRGADASMPEDRVTRYGTWGVAVGEDIVYQSRTPRDDVIALLIDDGVKTRGHRQNIYKSDFHVLGLAMGPRASKPPICVITFAGEFSDKGSGTGARRF